MNKFHDIGKGRLLDDLSFLRQAQYTKNRLEREFSGDFRLKPRDVTERAQFACHPQNIDEGSDASSECSSLKHLSASSSRSNVNVELDNYQENKLKIKNARRKLQRKLMRTEQEDDYDLDIETDDSRTITPKNTSRTRMNIGPFANNKITNKTMITVSQRTIITSNGASQKNIMSEPVFEKKFKIFVEKSLHTISDIRNLLEKGIDPPDGDEDISRRQLRVKEFSNRFSRNYLYPIVRQLDDLKNWKPSNPNRHPKLLSAYQIILNGLQAYLNHLPTSIGGCSSDKLKLLLRHLLELCDIHNNVLNISVENNYCDFLNTFRLNAELTLQKIEDHFTAVSTESMLKSTTTKISLPHYRNDQSMNKKNKPKNNIEERLSMYSATCSFRRDPLWKKAVETLAKKRRLNVKSRYKTALYKHRPPMEKPGTQIIALPSKSRLIPKKSSMIFKKTPVTTPVNEDDIETLVEMERNNDENVEKCDENEVELMNHDEIVVKLLQLVLDNNRRAECSGNDEEKSKGDEKIANILEKLRKGGDVEVLRKILETLQNTRSCKENLELKVVGGSEGVEEGAFEKRKEPTITVTGARNAKLICITDDNSLIETVDDELEYKDNQTEKCIPLKSISTSQTQTEYNNNNKIDKSTQRPATSISMKRLMKSSKCLEMLPKNFAVNIIQYKLDFHKHCKSIPIYRRTANILPWKLMGKISDEILDLAILRVAKEIEVNDIVDCIYQSELQL